MELDTSRLANHVDRVPRLAIKVVRSCNMKALSSAASASSSFKLMMAVG
jgi:hypothetical protein